MMRLFVQRPQVRDTDTCNIMTGIDAKIHREGYPDWDVKTARTRRLNTLAFVWRRKWKVHG